MSLSASTWWVNYVIRRWGLLARCRVYSMVVGWVNDRSGSTVIWVDEDLGPAEDSNWLSMVSHLVADRTPSDVNIIRHGVQPQSVFNGAICYILSFELANRLVWNNSPEHPLVISHLRPTAFPCRMCRLTETLCRFWTQLIMRISFCRHVLYSISLRLNSNDMHQFCTTMTRCQTNRDSVWIPVLSVAA